jgi:hypothetical protein
MVVVESIQTNLIEVVSPNRISGLALAFVRARRNCRLKRVANRGPAPLLQLLAASNPLHVGYLWRSRPTETVLSDASAFENHSNQATDNPL